LVLLLLLLYFIYFKKDRLKAREQAAFNISQLIEYSEEQDHLNLNKFFLRWIKLIKNESTEEVTKYIHNTIADDQSNLIETDIKIGKQLNFFYII
jgi:hypothetical protein